MNSEDLKKYPNGVYYVRWKTGSYSVASIGTMYNGDRWLAPSNWTSDKEKFRAPVDYWDYVESLQLISTSYEANLIRQNFDDKNLKSFQMISK